MKLALAVYKRGILPFMVSLLRALGVETQCKFHPTCSEYAAQAMAAHGPYRGTALLLKRVMRCHPLASGGVDPVPHPHSLLSHGRNH